VCLFAKKKPTLIGSGSSILSSSALDRWCNGNTGDSKSLNLGSIPSRSAISVVGRMVMQTTANLKVGGSIPSQRSDYQRLAN